MGPDDEFQHLGAALELVAGHVIMPVAAMHRVISDRAFRWVGPTGEPVRRVHDSIVAGVYDAIPRVVGVTGRGTGVLLARRYPQRRAISTSSTASRIQAAFNAIWGDRLDERGNGLSVSLGVRHAGHEVTPDEESLQSAYPNAAKHVVFLVHGLGQTEAAWLRPGMGGVPGLHDSLAATGHTTPVLVRYNTGLSTVHNGEQLAALVDTVSACWPIPQPSVSLVGFSMGGLVVRSAFGAGLAARSDWAERLRQVVTIGAPHAGALAARGAQLAAWSLRIAKTTRPLGAFLDAGSRGLADLRDGGGGAGTVRRVLAASSATSRQRYIAAVVTRRSTHPAGALIGDVMVRVPSATEPASSSENVKIVSGRRHFDLLPDPDVISQVVAWLETESDGEGDRE